MCAVELMKEWGCYLMIWYDGCGRGPRPVCGSSNCGEGGCTMEPWHSLCE